MKLQIGTKVKFLNATGGGIVRGFRDDKIVLVETDDGFEIPVLANELIVEENTSYSPEDNLHGTTEDQQEAEKKLPVAEVSFEEKKYMDFAGEILLAVVPENDKLLHVSKFGLFLVNDSNYYFQYVVSAKESGVSSLIHSGTIEPDTKLKVEEFSQTSIARIKAFCLQGSFFKYGLMSPVEPLNVVFEIEDISFYKSFYFKDNEYFHERALIFRKDNHEEIRAVLDQMKEQDLDNIVKVKETGHQKEPSKSPKKEDIIEEVDLHIGEIVDNYAELGNGEILNIQMSRFETALETALRGTGRRIVFIHGVGNGKLKFELRKKLDTKYPELRYQDASFKEYGYGATMVYLKS